MPNWLLWTDSHFSDNPLEEYRWKVFEYLLSTTLKYDVTEIINLGDAVDRKDKHSSVLVNRLIDEFSFLQVNSKAEIKILRGNHDTPINGPPFWKFLDKLGIRYITKPELYKNVWLLPFSSNPKEEWKELNFGSSLCILMHQTGQGATIEGGRELISHDLPIFPREIPIMSGDVHRPQFANGINYLGSCHPVRFSETWLNRMLVVKDDDFAHPIEIPLNYIKRAILDIKNSSELEKLAFSSGDQVRVRYALSSKELSCWPEEQKKIKKWADDKGILIASTEAILVGEGIQASTTEEIQQLETMRPDEVVKKFSEDEKLDPNVVEMGIQLIRSV